MKILSCCPLAYYQYSSALTYEYLSFVEIPRRMGHTVHHFDYPMMVHAGREAMNDFFLSVVKTGGYDLVFVMTQEDEFIPEVLDEARRHTVTAAWNCDDDRRWASYSSHWAPHYTYMVTTYRNIYEENRAQFPNLLLSQWGCTGFCDGWATPKDIDISFVGWAGGQRIEEIKRLQRELGMQAYGRNVPPPLSWLQQWKRRIAWRVLGLRWEDDAQILKDQDAVKAVWNRSRICFTPLYGTAGTSQIKARVFDQGLSGAVMLCTKNPALYEYYEPEKEFVEYETMEECISRARHLLTHDAERLAIARRYYERTRNEHLWTHRFQALYQKMGLIGNS
ncbi:MAG: glycosyltransferase [Candidatus Sumerlaeota bacterium]|nr:glycosyltransferase [Candidatus Sumerlaeota bacterium]